MNQMEPSRAKPASTILTLIALLCFVLLFVFFIYTFLHEAGHALTGLLFGQTLTGFNVNFWNLDAHVDLNGSLTQFQRAIQSAAGAGLPLLVWALFISLVPRKAGFIIEALKLTASMAVINTLLAWIVLPILFFLGRAPSDDVTNFLRSSQVPPLGLMALAAGLYAACWKLFLAKIDGLRNEFLLFGQVDSSALRGGMRSLRVMTGILGLGIVLTLTANSLAAQNSSGHFSPPQDFQPAATIDLSSRAYSNEVLASFSLDQAGYAGVFITVRNINTRYFDLSISGPDGFKNVILHGEGYRADQDGGLWEQNLSPGEYRLILNSAQNPGTVSVYLKYPKK